MIEPWAVRRTKELHRNRIFSLREDWCADPRDGKEHPFWVLDACDWVNSVARTEAGEYILVAQWRMGVRAVSIEIPGGMVDPGEAPAVAAARELVEETGYLPGTLVSLGTIDPNPAIQGNRLHVFAAEGCRPAAASERRDGVDALERLEVRLASAAELDALVARGEIRHALVLAALLKYRLARGGAP